VHSFPPSPIPDFILQIPAAWLLNSYKTNVISLSHIYNSKKIKISLYRALNYVASPRRELEINFSATGTKGKNVISIFVLVFLKKMYNIGVKVMLKLSLCFN
jgi:hypothetical protein